MDQSGRALAGAASAAQVLTPTALDGECTPRQDLLPLILQQIQLSDKSQAGQYSKTTRAVISFISLIKLLVYLSKAQYNWIEEVYSDFNKSMNCIKVIDRFHTV